MGEWVRSSSCGNGSGVEIQFVTMPSGRYVWLRATKSPTAVIEVAEWEAFIAAVKKGEFDALPEPAG